MRETQLHKHPKAEWRGTPGIRVVGGGAVVHGAGVLEGGVMVVGGGKLVHVHGGGGSGGGGR